MTMRGPAQTSDPVVLTLYQLIDAIGTGRLLIPSLRPHLVWSWADSSNCCRA
jgi:hypothetical protein